MIEKKCESDRCFCCGKGHYCEPEHYPSNLSDTWDCTECGRHHIAFDPHNDNLPAWVTPKIPPGTLGWRSRGVES